MPIEARETRILRTTLGRIVRKLCKDELVESVYGPNAVCTRPDALSAPSAVMNWEGHGYKWSSRGTYRDNLFISCFAAVANAEPGQW